MNCTYSRSYRRGPPRNGVESLAVFEFDFPESGVEGVALAVLVAAPRVEQSTEITKKQMRGN